ncbi:MAG: hypothetical protein R3362_00070 [Rhodothermales bacterium]|nr:hypothetical protein [Rhodothermales bacterium]
MQRGVYEHAASPYRKLLLHAGIEFGDVRRSVQTLGVEETLGRLYDAGVRLSSREFKGRVPVRRDGLEFEVRPEDFDNPLLVPQYVGRTGGSRGAGRRVTMEFTLIEQEAAYVSCMLDAFGLRGRPIILWRAAPPVTAAINQVLRSAKLGVAVERWFATGPLVPSMGEARFAVLPLYSAVASRFGGVPLPMPRYLPLAAAPRVVRVLADHVAAGRPPLCEVSASLAVHLCRVAREHGMDIAGTFFRLGGEPFTEAKARALREAGCVGVAPYSTTETGNLAMPCADAAAHDDLHVMTDKVALITRRRAVGEAGRAVDALTLTTLAPACPKLMLNVETDDYGVLERRPCGCPLGELGFDLHVRQIRSYDKLTSHGVTFLGGDLVELLERALPARFGGGPTDYQFVEHERGGVSEVHLVVGPGVGPVDEGRVIAAVYAFLDGVPGGRIMANEWRQGGALRVVRRPPYRTAAGKVLSVHVRQEVES